MKVYTSKEVHKFVRNSGWVIKSSNGSHIKYLKNGRTMVIPCDVNRMLIQRLNKQFNLGMF